MEPNQRWDEMDMDDEENQQDQSQAHHHPEGSKEETENPAPYKKYEGNRGAGGDRPYRKPQLSSKIGYKIVLKMKIGEEMIEKVKNFKGAVYLNLFNVDYKATEKDLSNLYSDVKVRKLEQTEQRGIFQIQVEDANEALKLFTGAERVCIFSFSLFLNVWV